jgi:hypothetical protein
MVSETQLNPSAIRTYLYLIKVGKTVGPREVMREVKLSSPSVAYRNLQKLIDMKLAFKDKFCNYGVQEKRGINCYFWIGERLIPRLIIFGIIFFIVLIIEMLIILPHIVLGSTIEGSFWLLTIVTIVSATIFIIEGVKWKKNKLSLKNPKLF